MRKTKVLFSLLSKPPHAALSSAYAMDPALHVRRGHGQRCVFSARGVGTVCVRCVAEVLSLTDPEPLTQRDHPSVLALATTRARYARALAELVRDPAAGPDVADAWGHVLVAASSVVKL